MNDPWKSYLERIQSLRHEGWKLEPASVFTNDDKTEVAVVFADGRFFRGTLAE